MLTLTDGNVAQIGDITIISAISMTCWRREWDSNPRYGFPHTRFPSVRLKPLGHLSGGPLLKGQDGFCKGRRASAPKFPQFIEFIRKCQSALDWDPLSASKRDPFERRV